MPIGFSTRPWTPRELFTNCDAIVTHATQVQLEEHGRHNSCTLVPHFKKPQVGLAKASTQRHARNTGACSPHSGQSSASEPDWRVDKRSACWHTGANPVPPSVIEFVCGHEKMFSHASVDGKTPRGRMREQPSQIDLREVTKILRSNLIGVPPLQCDSSNVHLCTIVIVST